MSPDLPVTVAVQDPQLEGGQGKAGQEEGQGARVQDKPPGLAVRVNLTKIKTWLCNKCFKVTGGIQAQVLLLIEVSLRQSRQEKPL